MGKQSQLLLQPTEVELGLQLDNNNNNDKNPHLNFLKGTVLGDKEPGVGIRDKGQGIRVKSQGIRDMT